jgi:hypothetical protein
MSKKNKPKIPKKILGLKLSKGTRKDLRKLVKLIETPETRGLAIAAASVALGFLAKKMAPDHALATLGDTAAQAGHTH